MLIGVIQFPCPKCFVPAPIQVMKVGAESHFSCVNVTCGFKRPIGDKFPSISGLMTKLADLDEETARAKIVDALTAWYLDWSDAQSSI